MCVVSVGGGVVYVGLCVGVSYDAHDAVLNQKCNVKYRIV